ncbi:MAG: hypothetical protein IJI54_06140 [Kiritimatiellae bacterium]|nr:hypothetical protein [Kiritimatiellia bacterium]
MKARVVVILMLVVGLMGALEQEGQVCIASRGKVEKLCMEVNAGVSADVSIRALWGSGGLKSP